MSDNQLKLIMRFPPGEPIVSIVVHKGRILVATSKALYELIDGKVVPLEIQAVEK